MEKTRKLIWLAMISLLAACSQSQDTEKAADTAIEPEKKAIAGDDGGIPLSPANEAAMKLYEQVRASADSGDFIEANQSARKLTAEAPDFPGGWIMLGNTALSGEQFARASAEAVKRSANGTKGEQLWAQINMSFVENNAEKGLQLGKELVDTYPDSPRAWVVYSGLLTGQNMHEKAREAGAKAIELAPEHAFTHNNLGFSYMNNAPKHFEKAKKHFMAAKELEPEDDNIRVNIGDVHRAMRELEAARDDYSAALELDSTNAVAAVKRGHVNSFLGNYDEARADYDAGLANSQEGSQTTLAVYRAFVNLHADDPAAAVEELWGEAAKIDGLTMPADQKIATRIFVLINIADIAFHNGMGDEAQKAVDQLTAALAESGSNAGDANFERQQKAQAAFWQGKLAAHQGNYEQAAARAEEFAALVENDANPRRLENYHELLALIEWKQGNHDKAIEHYRQANMSTAPNFGDVKNAYRLATSLQATGQSDEASALIEEVANWNFNSAWFAMLRKEAA